MLVCFDANYLNRLSSATFESKCEVCSLLLPEAQCQQRQTRQMFGPPKKFGRIGPLVDKHIGTFCNGNYKKRLKSPIKAFYCRLKIIPVCAGDHWLCRGYLQSDSVGVVELVN